MNLDGHNDYFLDEDDKSRTQTPDSGRTINFGDAPADAAAPKPQSPRRHPFRKVIGWTIVIGVVILAVVFYVRYLNPYAVDARATGYVTSLEKRGIVFKTFEGTMATESSMGDTTRVYTRDFAFTVPDDSLARRIQDAAAVPGNRITLVYERYYATLPWRGSSVNVVTGIIGE